MAFSGTTTVRRVHCGTQVLVNFTKVPLLNIILVKYRYQNNKEFKRYCYCRDLMCFLKDFPPSQRSKRVRGRRRSFAQSKQRIPQVKPCFCLSGFCSLLFLLLSLLWKVKQVNQCFLLSCHADVCSLRKQLTFTLTSFLCLILVNICRFLLLWKSKHTNRQFYQ